MAIYEVITHRAMCDKCERVCERPSSLGPNVAMGEAARVFGWQVGPFDKAVCQECLKPTEATKEEDE